MRIIIASLASLLFMAANPVSAQERTEIDEVIKVEVAPDACGITDAVMTYRDAHGVEKKIAYKTWGYGCQTYQ